MAKASKKNQFKPSIAFRAPTSTLNGTPSESTKIIPRFIRQRLQRTSNQDSQIPDNRRQKTTPELQAYIQGIDENQVKKTERRAIRELAHYAYAFDIDFYKNQLPREESEKINNLGNCLQHYCTTGWKLGIDPSPLFETNNYFSKYPDIKESGINPMVHFFKFGIREGRYSMDDIHFMRKTATYKKSFFHRRRQARFKHRTEENWVFLHIFYPELAPTIADYLGKIPTNIDIYISTNQDSIDKLKRYSMA